MLICGLKGDKENKFRKLGQDTAKFKKAHERGNLYIVDVNLVKDELAGLINLQWDRWNDSYQPPGFMNYPTPSGGKYLFDNFFSHYEAEHKIPDLKDGEMIGYKWVKKTSVSQNHFFDVRVYNIVLRDIFVYLFGKEAKITNPQWSDFVNMALGRKK
jgi:hypothetical protein